MTNHEAQSLAFEVAKSSKGVSVDVFRIVHNPKRFVVEFVHLDTGRRGKCTLEEGDTRDESKQALTLAAERCLVREG